MCGGCARSDMHLSCGEYSLLRACLSLRLSGHKSLIIKAKCCHTLSVEDTQFCAGRLRDTPSAMKLALCGPKPNVLKLYQQLGQIRHWAIETHSLTLKSRKSGHDFGSVLPRITQRDDSAVIGIAGVPSDKSPNVFATP